MRDREKLAEKLAVITAFAVWSGWLLAIVGLPYDSLDWTRFEGLSYGIPTPTATSTPGPTPTRTPIAQVDFKLDRDGYGFPNWSDLNAWAEFSAQWEAMIDTYNPSDLPVPLVKRELLPFIFLFYKPYGYCFGMASTSILYWQYPEIKPRTDRTTFQLTYDEARSKIVEYQQKQFPWYLDAMQLDLNRQTSPMSEYSALASYLQVQHKPVMLLMLGNDGAHAVVAYGIIDNGNAKTAMVYDNNYPSEAKTATFNLANNTFYGSTGPYTYDRVYVRYPDLNWPDSVSETLRSAFYGVVGWLRVNGLLQIQFHSPVTGLATDSQGRRIGYVGGQFVNEIPRAQMYQLGEETFFYLPSNERYTATATGTAGATSTSTLEVDIVVPTTGTSTKWVSYSGVPVSPGSTATVVAGSLNTDYTMRLDSGVTRNPDTVVTIDDVYRYRIYLPALHR